MNAKTFSFFIIFLASFFAFATVSLSIVSAQEKVGGVEIKDVKISTKNDNIEITAVLFNPSQNIETSPFTYLLTLSSINELFKFKKSVITPPPIIVSAIEGDDYTSLKPQEQKIVNFSLPISPRLPKNNYTLNIAMILSGGEALGFYRDVIYDLGSSHKVGDSYKSGFLAFDQQSCVMITPDGRKFGNNDGPIFKPLETPKINCAIKNVGAEEITVFPNIEWKELFVYGRPANGKKAVEKSDKAITLKSGEIKTTELSLPAAERPQVYQALLSFINKDNIVRSYNMDFRWTIGGSSARVEKVALASPVKSVYEAGENISLSVDYFGSMDLFWGGISDDKVSPLTEVKISAVIKDKKGNICGQKEVSLPNVNDARIHNKIIDIALDKKCEGVSYDTSLFSRGENLANASDIFPVVIEEGVEEEKTKTSFIYYIIGALVIIFSYKIFTVINRRRHKDDWQKNLVVFLFIAGITGFFFGGFNTAEAVKTLTVQNRSDDGIGTGVIKEPSDATNINCSTGGTNGIGDCDGDYVNNAIITLTAIPGPGSLVSKWVGGGPNCPLSNDINKCQTKMSVSKTIKAWFARAYTLTIEPGPGPAPGVPDDGSGKVIENSSKINCDISGGVSSGICNDDYVSDSDVYISGPLGEVEPAGTSIFTGWTGDCIIDGTNCDLTMTGNKTAKAVFRLISNLFKSFTPKLKEYIGNNNSFTGSTNSLFVAVSKGFVSQWRSFNISSAVVTFNGSVNDNKVEINNNLNPLGCGNTAYVFERVKMTVGADGLAEQPVNFRKYGSTNPYSPEDSGFDITKNAEQNRSYEIDPSYLTSLESKINPYLNIYITAATRPFGVLTYSRRGFFDFSYTDAYNFNVDLNQFGVVGTTLPDIFPADEAYDASDVIKIKIPLTLPPPNSMPVLSPIGNKTVNEGQVLPLAISATDIDDDPLTFTVTNKPSGAVFTDNGNKTATFSWTPSFSQSGTYSGVHFEVSDGKGGTDSEDIIITVNNVNQLPTATINPPTSIEKFDNDGTGVESVTLNGSSSSDPDGTITDYKWEETGAFAFSVSNPTPTLTRNFAVGSHAVTLTVTDNNGGVSPVSSPPATIIVNANALPTANAGVNQTVIDADGNGSESVTLDGSGSVDPNGGTITDYKWEETGAFAFSVSNPTPTLTRNFAVGSHAVTLTVTDNGDLTGTNDVSITVNPSAPPTPSSWWDLFRTLWKEKE